MNSEKTQQKMEEYYNNTTPEQVVAELKKLGVEFIDTQREQVVEALKLLHYIYINLDIPDLEHEQCGQIIISLTDQFNISFDEYNTNI